MTIEVLTEDDRWAEFEIETLAARAAAAVIRHLGLPALTLACLATNDTRIAALNAEFRGKPTPTNVLSWPSETLAPASPGEAPPPPTDPEIGDIALSYDTCAAEAEATGVAFGDHVTHLVVHGVLHLLGYDHETEADAGLMETTEIAILMSLGIANPYL